jgi:hypothetical protein
MPKSNPLYVSPREAGLTDKFEFESAGNDALLGVRRGAGGSGGVSSMNERNPREKLWVDDRAVEPS